MRTANSFSYSIPSLFCTVLLLAVAFLFRWPAIINPGGVNSDAAVVALQGLHTLNAEWSLYLWGAGYQSSLESFLAAFYFSIFGPSATSLMYVSLSGYVVMLLCAYSVLNRRLGPAVAFFLCLPIVIVVTSLNGNTLTPPRQWSTTAVFAAVALFDGAIGSRYRGRMLFWGGFLTLFATYLDFYALIFLPGLLWLGTASALEDSFDRVTFFLGLGVGLAALVLLRLAAPGSGGTASFSIRHLSQNWKLLWETCLPIILGGKIFLGAKRLYPDLWHSEATGFSFIQIWGAASFFVAVVAGGLLSFTRSVPNEIRRLGQFGAITTLITILGFLLSKKVVDMYSARYLAPLIWTAPFSLAPLLQRLRFSLFSLSLMPYLAAVFTATWMGYGDAVRNGEPVRYPFGQATAEKELGSRLREHGVTIATAPYWLAYRLSFLFNENPIVTPTDPGASRYAPYQNALIKAPIVAQIFHPSETEETPEAVEEQLFAKDIPHQRIEIAGYTVLIKYLKGAPLGD